MGWGNGMMGGGYSFGWLFMILFWVVLIGVIVFLVVKLLPSGGTVRKPPGAGVPPNETPEQTLDRMFALGEIDEATYRARRIALTEMRGPR